MKFYYLLTLFVLGACANDSKKIQPIGTLLSVEASNEIRDSRFGHILDNVGLNGAILIYDLTNDTYYSNDFKWAKTGRIPASTFKIPNSIIALETGIVTDNTIFKWDGKKRRLKNWEQDLNLKQAFQFSCVPCYQDVARKIGSDRMRSYLNRLDFGTMEFDSSTIDLFWLTGESKITQFEQIDFLISLHKGHLPIAEKTRKSLQQIMLIKDTEDYVLSGKTGWAVRDGRNNGWFVGYVETRGQQYYFATNVSPKSSFDMKSFPKIRQEVTLEALRTAGVIKGSRKTS